MYSIGLNLTATVTLEVIKIFQKNKLNVFREGNSVG